MNEEAKRQVASILAQADIQVLLDLRGGLRGISQNTWQKILERMEPSGEVKGLFHLPVASVELRLIDGCVVSPSEVRQLLRLCGGFVPLCIFGPDL